MKRLYCRFKQDVDEETLLSGTGAKEEKEVCSKTNHDYCGGWGGNFSSFCTVKKSHFHIITATKQIYKEFLSLLGF